MFSLYLHTLFPSKFALWGPGDIYVGDVPHAATGLTSWPGPTWPLPFTVASPEQPFPVLASLFWNHPTSFQACALEVPVPQTLTSAGLPICLLLPGLLSHAFFLESFQEGPG